MTKEYKMDEVVVTFGKIVLEPMDAKLRKFKVGDRVRFSVGPSGELQGGRVLKVRTTSPSICVHPDSGRPTLVSVNTDGTDGDFVELELEP